MSSSVSSTATGSTAGGGTTTSTTTSTVTGTAADDLILHNTNTSQNSAATNVPFVASAADNVLLSTTLVSAFGDDLDVPPTTLTTTTTTTTSTTIPDKTFPEVIIAKPIHSSGVEQGPPAIDVNGIIIAESTPSIEASSATTTAASNRTPSQDDPENSFLRTVDSYSSLVQLSSDVTGGNNHNNNSNMVQPNNKTRNRSRTNTSESLEDTSQHSQQSQLSQQSPAQSSATTPAVIIPRDFSYGRGINQHSQDPTVPPRYELKVHIIRGNVAGGGLGNAAHVEVFIDDLLIHRTENSPTSPYVWNETVKFSFHDLEGPKAPVMVALSLYKKRWTSSGFKLVGTSQVAIKDLSDKILDKQGIIDKEFPFNVNRSNLTLTGGLYLGFQLKTINPNDKIVHHSSTANANIIIPRKSAFSTNLSLIDGTSSPDRLSEIRESSLGEETEHDRMSMRDSAVHRYQQSKGTASVRFSSIVPEHELIGSSKAHTTAADSNSGTNDGGNNAEDILADDPATSGESSAANITPFSTRSNAHNSRSSPQSKNKESYDNMALLICIAVIVLLLILNMRQYKAAQSRLTSMHSQVDLLIKNIKNMQQCSFK